MPAGEVKIRTAERLRTFALDLTAVLVELQEIADDFNRVAERDARYGIPGRRAMLTPERRGQLELWREQLRACI